MNVHCLFRERTNVRYPPVVDFYDNFIARLDTITIKIDQPERTKKDDQTRSTYLVIGIS